MPQTQAAQPAAGGAPNEGAAPVILSGGVPGGTATTEKPAHAPGQTDVQPAIVGENSSPPTHVASAAPSFPPKADNTAAQSQAGLLPLRPLLGKMLVSVYGSTFDLIKT